MKYLPWVVAIAATVFTVPSARAEMACYIEIANRQVDLTGVCDGSQSQAAITMPEFQPSLMVYGMQNDKVWQDHQWQPSRQVSMSLANMGDAAANNVTLVIRGERQGATGEVEQVEFRTVTVTEVPARVTGNLAVEFSFIPTNCELTSIVWN